MIVLVTGVPGVGKTTLCQFLAANWPEDYVHVSFGSFILRALNSEGITEPDLRRSAASLVSRNILAEATEILMAEVTKESRRFILVDSHAVSQDRFGYVVTPDGSSYFNRLKYGVIVQLHALPSTILSRSAAVITGRQARHEKDVEMHLMLQSAVSVGYSSASECPLYVVQAEEPVERVAAVVDGLVRGVG
jgi:adenylate kinase